LPYYLFEIYLSIIKIIRGQGTKKIIRKNGRGPIAVSNGEILRVSYSAAIAGCSSAVAPSASSSGGR
jgi:hypothetical protein